MKKEYLLIIVAFFMLSSCSSKKEQVETTPWGTTIGDNDMEVDDEAEKTNKASFSLDDIINNGELIMLTINGPTTYYDYHGKGMGLQYLLCEKFAQQIGVSLRVEECKDTTEMIAKLQKGVGDVIAVPLERKKVKQPLLYCGAKTDGNQAQWAVAADNKSLADTLNHWFSPKLIAQVQQEENFLLSARSIKRHVYSPFLNRSKGVISKYDHLFQMYSGMARMDWRLMAAQCYQESCFDPQAKSWAGACGLMQIMPSTAAHLGLPMSMVHEPESNVAAAAKYMAELQGHFSDIGDPAQRILFALAAYNGGYHHIRDAMSLARKYGRSPYNWGDVREFVLRLSQPAYYGDAVVKHGYMRGSETADYVERIRMRWADYCGVAGGSRMNMGGMGGGFHYTPVKSKRAYGKKYHI